MIRALKRWIGGLLFALMEPHIQRIVDEAALATAKHLNERLDATNTRVMQGLEELGRSDLGQEVDSIRAFSEELGVRVGRLELFQRVTTSAWSNGITAVSGVLGVWAKALEGDAPMADEDTVEVSPELQDFMRSRVGSVDVSPPAVEEKEEGDEESSD